MLKLGWPGNVCSSEMQIKHSDDAKLKENIE